MFVIIGIAVVVVAVIGGFMFAGGDVILLIQPAEFVVIVGAAVGSLLISAPIGCVKKNYKNNYRRCSNLMLILKKIT